MCGRSSCVALHRLGRISLDEDLRQNHNHSHHHHRHKRHQKEEEGQDEEERPEMGNVLVGVRRKRKERSSSESSADSTALASATASGTNSRKFSKSVISEDHEEGDEDDDLIIEDGGGRDADGVSKDDDDDDDLCPSSSSSSSPSCSTPSSTCSPPPPPPPPKPTTATTIAKKKKERSDSLKENVNQQDVEEEEKEEDETDGEIGKKDPPETPTSKLPPKWPLLSSLSAPLLLPTVKVTSSEDSGSSGSWGPTSADHPVRWDQTHLAGHLQPVSWMPMASLEEEEDHEEAGGGGLRGCGVAPSVVGCSSSRRRFMDPAHGGGGHHHNRVTAAMRRASDPDMSRKLKLRQLKKQLGSVRRKLEELQLDFEAEQGYKPSMSDKHSDRSMRRLLSEKSSLKRQIRSYRDCNFPFLSGSSNNTAVDFDSDNNLEDENSNDSLGNLYEEDEGDEVVEDDHHDQVGAVGKSLESIRNTLHDIEQRLRVQRQMKGRPSDLDAMTPDQLVQEKVDLHSALSEFEGLFGSPGDTSNTSTSSSDDFSSMTKGIYERYRTVKRLVRRSSAQSKDQLELETIPEDEALPLTLASPQHRIHIEVMMSSQPTDESPLVMRHSSKTVMDRPDLAAAEEEEVDASNGGGEGGSEHQGMMADPENLHALSRYELLEVLRRTRDEKRAYRRAVKEKEERFQRETGRRLLRGERDKAKGEDVHRLYKKSKAKIKLLDALLSKSRTKGDNNTSYHY